MMVEQDGELIDPLSLSGRMRVDDAGSGELMKQNRQPVESRNHDAGAAEEYPDEQ